MRKVTAFESSAKHYRFFLRKHRSRRVLQPLLVVQLRVEGIILLLLLGERIFDFLEAINGIQ